jgi:hypothetical protein
MKVVPPHPPSDPGEEPFCAALLRETGVFVGGVWLLAVEFRVSRKIVMPSINANRAKKT